MGKLYNFIRLINKYSNTVELITSTEGKYVDGKWQDGLTTTTNIRGAVIPLPESKIYQSGGTLSKTDRQFICTSPILKPQQNVKIKYKDKTYSVEEDTDYGDYADAYIYILKWVSGFDKSTTH